MTVIVRSRRLRQQFARRSRMTKGATVEASHPKRTRRRDLPNPIEEGCGARVSIGAITPPLRRHRQQIGVEIDRRAVVVEHAAACRRRDPLRRDAPRDERKPAVDQHPPFAIEAATFAHRRHRRLLEELLHVARRVGDEYAVTRASLGRRGECHALDRFAAELNALRGEVEPHVARGDDQAAFRRRLDRIEISDDALEQRRHLDWRRIPIDAFTTRHRHEDLALGGVGGQPTRISTGVDDRDGSPSEHRCDRFGIGIRTRIAAHAPAHALDDGDERRERRHPRPDATSSRIRHDEQSAARVWRNLVAQSRVSANRAQRRPRLAAIGGGEHEIREASPRGDLALHA